MVTLSGLSLVAACPGAASLPRVKRASGAASLGTAIHELLEAVVNGHDARIGAELIDASLNLSADDAGRLAFLATHLRLPVPAGALAEVPLGYWPDGVVRRVVGGAGEYEDEGQILSGTLDAMWAEPEGLLFGVAGEGYQRSRHVECPAGSTLWTVDWKTGDEDHVPPVDRNWQLRAGALLAARWTGASRVIPAICYINASECAEAVRAGRVYEGRWEVGAPLDAAALDAIEVELRAVLARAKGASDGRQEQDGADVCTSGAGVRGDVADPGTDPAVAPTRRLAPPLVLGPHCEHCPARGACPALAAEALTLARAAGWNGGDDAETTRNHTEQGGSRGGAVGAGDGLAVLPGAGALPVADGLGAGATAPATPRGLVEGRRPVPLAVLTPEQAARLAGLVPAIRRALDAADDALRAHVRATGRPLVLANGQEWGPALEPVTRYKTAPTFEALAEVVGDERANGAFTTTSTALREALDGQERGAWRRLQEAIRARGGEVPGVREVWRKRWPAKPAEVVGDGTRRDDLLQEQQGQQGDGREERMGEEERGRVRAGLRGPYEGGEAGPGAPADAADGGAAQAVAGPVTRAPCPVCGDPYTLTRGGGMRKHNINGGPRCAGSGKPPAQLEIGVT